MDNIEKLRQTGKWAEVVLIQGQRVLEGNMRYLFWRRPAVQVCPAPQEKDFEHFDHIRSADEHFFLIAVFKTLRWLTIVGSVSPDIDAARVKFRAVANEDDVQDLRNFREHDEDYLVGEGRKQKLAATRGQKYPVANPLPDPHPWADRISILKTGAYVTRDAYYLGAKVEIRTILRQAAELLAVITARTGQ